MSGLSLTNLKNRIKHGSVAMFFLAANIGAVTVPFLPAQVAEAAPVCTVDTAAANDESGQKDLTKLCVDYANVPTTLSTTWNWDELGTTGSNTLDACSLFDTDGDGNVNYAVCVTTKNTPATFFALTTYSCGDTKIDRCTSTSTAVSNGTTNCSVSQKNNDPFAGGTSAPNDTESACTIQLSTVGGVNAKLVDVCSFPSAQPNSDPSDCVIAQDDSGKLEVRKDIVPNDAGGLFNLRVDGVTKAANAGDNGTTGEVVVNDGNRIVSETAGTGTNLSSYSTSITCRSLNGTGPVIASGNSTSLVVPVAEDSDVVCIITNTALSSITIVKDAKPNSSQDFSFTASGTGVSNFILDDDDNATLSNTKTFTSLVAGSYVFTEAVVSGWDFKDIVCNEGASVQKTGASVTVTLGAGQNVTCTFTNLKRGSITVNKVTDPAADPTQFPVTATGTGSIAGSATRNVTTTTPVVYDVAQGAYAISENVPTGWAQTGNTCGNLVINATNLTTSCTITNTKLGSLTIIKDALPNDAQDFSFGVTGLTGGSFSLDDDADGTLPSQKVYSNLLPGQYSVTEQSIPGWALTGLVCSNTAMQGATANVTLAAGQNASCTFTNTKLGSIGGTKYTSDTDSNLGPVLSGWTIYIDSNNNGQLDQGEASDVTDQNGAYGFNDLLPDNYVLLEVLMAGWTQIFGADPVALGAGETSTGNDFGNFQNGSISGFKWNDKNANGVVNEDEEKLNGWTVTLYNAQNQALGSTVTANGGLYSFTNLAPGSYSVCETQQTNWVQTYPASNGCHTITIDKSGESNQANFGNQGRGSIKVVKNVDMNNDGDVEDEGDIVGAPDWTWDINGDYHEDENVATGSTKTNIPAGTYTISEDQQTNFHFVSVTCGELKITQAESFTLELNPGDSIVCTFTNARDTAKIKVKKSLAPTNDEGRFDLYVGETKYASEVGDGGTTGWVTVPTGTYGVSEQGSEGTDLNDYVTTNQCGSYRNGVWGEGTSVEDLVLTKDAKITCTFYNERKANVVVTKYNDINRNGWFDEGEETLPDWDFNLVSETDCVPEYEDVYSFLSDVNYDEEECVVPYPDYAETQTTGEDGTTTFGNIDPNNDYILTETQKEGWYLSNIVCFSNQDYYGIPVEYGYYIEPNPGETIYCEVGNYRLADLQISKQNDQDDSVRTGTTVTYTLVVSLPEDSGAVFDAVVRDILPAGFTYVPDSWTSTASETTDPLFDPIGEWHIGDLYPGDSVTLTYEATIDDSVSPGTYTNIAYSEGCAIEQRRYDLARTLDVYDGEYVDQEPYCQEVVTTDFVTSDVTVYEPKVLAATKTVLVNTGSDDALRNALIGLSLVMMTITLAMATRNQQKGTK